MRVLLPARMGNVFYANVRPVVGAEILLLIGVERVKEHSVT